MNFPSHGACWLWNKFLITTHLIGDLGTGILYIVIPCIAIVIYKAGKLKYLKEAFPRLWTTGAMFVFFCGVSHFLSVGEIWAGGLLYYISGINKLFMLVASLLFAIEFKRHQMNIIQVGWILDKIREETEKED